MISMKFFLLSYAKEGAGSIVFSLFCRKRVLSFTSFFNGFGHFVVFEVNFLLLFFDLEKALAFLCALKKFNCEIKDKC